MLIETPLSSAIVMLYLSFLSPFLRLSGAIGETSMTTPITSIVELAYVSLIRSILVKEKPLFWILVSSPHS
jgi:hypothetical protein